MNSKWYHVIFVLFQVTTFVLVLIGRHIVTLPNSTPTIDDLYAISKAAATMIHVNIAILMLINSRSFAWLFRKAFLQVLDATTPALSYAGTFIFAMLHGITHLAVIVLRLINSDYESGFLARAVLQSGVGWSGTLLLVLCTAAVSDAVFLDVTRTPLWLARWFYVGFGVAIFALLAVHEAFCIPNWSNGSFMGGSDHFWMFWLAGALIILVEAIVLKVHPQRESRVKHIIPHPNGVYEIQFEKLAFRPIAGQYIVFSCPTASLVKQYQLALTSAPEEENLSVHIRSSDYTTRSLAMASGLALRAIRESGLDPVKASQCLPDFYIDELVGMAPQTVYDSQIAILIGVGDGVGPLASILKSILYRVNSPRKATMIQQVYFFWICDSLEKFKWFQSLLMGFETSNMPIQIYLYLTSPFDEAQATKHLINSAVHGIDLMTNLRNPARHGYPDWHQIFADIAEIHGESGSKVNVLYSGRERSVDLELQMKDEALMNDLGEVSYSRIRC